ncbi:hypothetical protein [Streptomyces beigongshangae]|uniref:hypothetical protein n=1 Tax=Streptomyces beigongshangae TaxID=2841597 RepID=UPI0027E00E17|nr:hypothetical protein [Streptomyces sp. REN17]
MSPGCCRSHVCGGSRPTTPGERPTAAGRSLGRCTEGPSAYLTQALEEPTALGVATAILAGTVRTTTRPAHPHGCLGAQSALTTSNSGQEVRDLLVARHLTTFAYGIAVQAAGGVDRDELQELADAALRNWPLS